MPRLNTPTESDKARAAADRQRLKATRQRKRAAGRRRQESKTIDRDLSKMIATRRETERRQRWRITAACFLCGRRAPEPDSRNRGAWPQAVTLALDPGRFGLDHGLTAAACSACRTAIDRDRPDDIAAVRDRLEATRSGYLPADAELRRWQLPPLIYAGRVLTARAAGDPDPESGEPFAHLPKSWDLIDFGPAPALTRTDPPPDPRRLDADCLVCGTDDTPSRDPGHRFDARLFGLDRAGGDVVGKLCDRCRGTHSGTAGLHYEDDAHYGFSASIAATVRIRITRERPSSWPLGRGEDLALDDVAPYTFAGAVILAREEGRPEPTPGEPFGWLA